MISDTVVLTCTSGRLDLLSQTLVSFREKMSLSETFEYVIVDDSHTGIPYDTLANLYFLANLPYPVVLRTHYSNRGFCYAIQEGHAYIKCFPRLQYVIHLEDDLLLTEQVSSNQMKAILDSNDNLAQIALLRDSVNHSESLVGGIYGCYPGTWEDRRTLNISWLSHKNFFTTNVCMYKSDLLHKFTWPDPPGCEGEYSKTLKAAGYEFGYLGSISDPPKTQHIGHVRNGCGY